MKSTRILFAAAAVVSAGLVVSAAGAETEAVVGTRAAEIASKGLDWLKANQKPSGAWSDENYPALTALGLWAVSGSGRDDLKETAEKAAAFVAGFAQKDGGIYKVPTGGRGTGGLSTYNTAICMTALSKYDKTRFAPVILKARDFIAGSQLVGDSPASGGFGYNRPGESRMDRPDLSNTGWALMAMRETQSVEDLRPAGGKRADVNWATALKYVESMQIKESANANDVGGFGYEKGGERGGIKKPDASAPEKPVALNGFGSMTYAGIEAMIYAEVKRDDPRVRSAIEWAGRHWSVDENPGMGLRGLFYYYTIMAKSLSLAGADGLKTGDGKAIDWKSDIVNKLAETQSEAGSWANKDNMFWENDPALVTSYAVIVLNIIK